MTATISDEGLPKDVLDAERQLRQAWEAALAGGPAERQALGEAVYRSRMARLTARWRPTVTRRAR